jgi:hypothetical protein
MCCPGRVPRHRAGAGARRVLRRQFHGLPGRLIAQGRDWYRRAAASPDSLAGHPAVAGRPWDNSLFYEEAAYAASYAFEQVTGDEPAFWDAVGPLARRGSGPTDMGEDFDFGDDQEMRTPGSSPCAGTIATVE